MTTATPTHSPFKTIVALLGWLLLCYAVAGLGGYWTAQSVTSWYPTLAKPPYNPPAWIFAPVWTTLYTMMAVSVWMVWKSPSLTRHKAIGIFLIHLALNLVWSLLFFGMQNPLFGLVDILALWLMVGVAIWMFWPISRWAGMLLVPYWLWVSFASVLNWQIWLLN